MAGRKRVLLAFLCIIGMSVAAGASETITYTYDALGRLTGSVTSGAVNNGLQTVTTFDPAGNRSGYSVSSASPPPSFSISAPAAVTEGGSLVYTVTKTGSTPATISLSYASANGTATAGSDYTATSGTLTFITGETSKTITVATTDDSAPEVAETVLVNLSGATGGATISTSQATGTINDNDTTPISFAISAPTTVTEGGSLIYTVTKSGATSASISVNYGTADGTATAGLDYTAASGSLTFAAGETSKTITVATSDDAYAEPSETVLVNLSGATGGATIPTSQATGTISDNDTTAISFAIGTPTAVTEGGSLVYTVTKSGATSASISVNFATANGTAVAGSDYTANTGTLTFAAGDTSKTITVATTDDSAPEVAETVLVNLSGATGGATISTTSATGTINDNDTTPISFAIGAPATVTEGGSLVYTVTKSGSTSVSVSVNYGTADGTAVAGSDYTATSGTLTFVAGDTSKTITVATTDDSAAEVAENVLVNLSGASGATISTSQATGTINDNDTTPISFAISAPSTVTEGGTLVYTVTKTGATSASISVNFATADGSAVAGSDYTATSGTLTFAGSETSKTISVSTTDDGAPEVSETVLVNLSSATGGATITTAQATGTINDNDTTAISFAISAPSAVTEGGSLVYTVTKTGSTSASISVNFATANGSATAGADYTATSGTLTFAAGESSKTITVSTTDDTTVESAETVLVNLSSASGGATISTSQASGTINDNDVAPSPPTAVADSVSVVCNGYVSKNLVANDTDPGGNYPLTLVSIAYGGGDAGADATIESSTSVGVTGNTFTGYTTFFYVVRNSLGLTATGTLTLHTTNHACE